MRQLNIRVEEHLYKALSEEAWRRRISLNKYAVRLLKTHPVRPITPVNRGKGEPIGGG